MSRILEASCVGGVVTVEGFVVPAEVLSEGAGPSTGILLVQGDQAFYIPSSASDLKTTIEKISATIEDVATALTQIGTTLTSIGAGMTGPTTSPPPTLAADVLAINGKVTELNVLKAELDVLGGSLA